MIRYDRAGLLLASGLMFCCIFKKECYAGAGFTIVRARRVIVLDGDPLMGPTKSSTSGRPQREALIEFICNPCYERKGWLGVAQNIDPLHRLLHNTLKV